MAIHVGSASAQREVDEGPVVVLAFEGPGAEPGRDAVVDSFADADLDLFPLARAAEIAKELGVDLNRSTGRRAVAEQEGILAFVGGESRRRGNRFRVSLFVYSGRDGAQVGLATVRARLGSMVRNLRLAAFRKLRGPLRRAEAPQAGPLIAAPVIAAPARRPEAQQPPEPPAVPRPAPPPSPRRPAAQARRPRGTGGRRRRGSEGGVRAPARGHPEETRAPQPTADRTDVTEDLRSPLVFGAGMSFVGRTLRYKDQVRALADHSLDPNPALLLQARIYPVAFVSQSFAGNLGVEIRYSYLLFATSRRGDEEFDTNFSDLRAGLHLRLPLGRHDLGLGVAYGQQSMAFSPADDDVPPEYSYSFLRLATDARLVFGSFAAEPYAALLVPFEFGEVASETWFPNTSGLGLEAGLQLGFALGGGVELFVGAAFRHWGLSFDPKPDDLGVVMYQRAVGGATDRYLAFDAGVAYRF